MINFQTIVFGRIVSGNSIERNRSILDNLDTDQTFPAITSPMFNFVESGGNHPNCNQIITFGASYKRVEEYLTSWVVKFEAILRSLDFVTAKIQVETDSYGTYDFFWLSKGYNYRDHCEEYYEEMGLFSADNWYFGVGKRNMWGALEDADAEFYLKNTHRFIYPFRILDEDLILLRKLHEEVGKGKVVYFDDLPNVSADRERLFQLFTYLHGLNKLEFKVKPNPAREDREEPYLLFKSDFGKILS